MYYENRPIKPDALIGYFNEKKMNLSLVFQRGCAWNLPMRRGLIKNIVRNGNKHSKGADVLKKFVDKESEDALTSEEKKKLRRVVHISGWWVQKWVSGY